MTLASQVALRSLKGDRAFQRLRKGRSGGAKYLNIRWLSHREGGVRVGIVVSKKVGKAVVRNRVRRRLSEALKSLLAELCLSPAATHQNQPAVDILVIARPEAAEADYWQLKTALAQALKRSQLVL